MHRQHDRRNLATIRLLKKVTEQERTHALTSSIRLDRDGQLRSVAGHESKRACFIRGGKSEPGRSDGPIAFFGDYAAVTLSTPAAQVPIADRFGGGWPFVNASSEDQHGPEELDIIEHHWASLQHFQILSRGSDAESARTCSNDATPGERLDECEHSPHNLSGPHRPHVPISDGLRSRDKVGLCAAQLTVGAPTLRTQRG